MSEKVLLLFLSNGLIDVKGDDAKLEKLKSTSQDLAAALKHSPQKTAPFALIAFDPAAPADDPVIREAIEVLQKQWPTYVNTFDGTPVAVIRAMLLEALFQTSIADDNIAVTFVACARNVLPHIEVGHEQTIWSEIVRAIETQVDNRAEREWATPSEISVEPIAFESRVLKFKPTDGTIDKGDLQSKILAATGPNGASNSNPNWPNNPGPWSQSFSQKLSDAMAEAIEAGRTTIPPIDISAPFKELTGAVIDYMARGMNAFAGATAGLQRRTNLIWWKESLFSPSRQISYRNMTPSVASALMGFDLYLQIPTFSPASVAAFLSEAVLTLPQLSGHADQRYSIGALSRELRVSDDLSPLRESARSLIPNSNGRGFLLALAAHLDSRIELDDRKFRDLVGVVSGTGLTLPEWAVWIFRELQAARATQLVAEEQKRARKGDGK